jgi:hypothetical protein
MNASQETKHSGSPIANVAGLSQQLRRYSYVILIAAFAAGLAFPQTIPPLSSNVSVYATGLNNPRGMKFGPDGALYVAEGGMGGTASSVGICPQVVAPIGPYTGGNTGRISRIGLLGARSTVVDGLPSSQTSSAMGSTVSGVADVAFVGSTMYALISGGGCSHGLPSSPNGVIQVNVSKGTWTQLADLSAFVASHPVANPSSDDFEPDGTFYNLIGLGDRLFTTEPNHGEIDEIGMDGTVRRVVDISESHGHIVPTALAYNRSQLYFGNLFLFPVLPASSNVFTYGSDKRIHVVVPQLTTVVGIAFDSQDRLYVLEMSAGAGGPGPGQGVVLRLEYNGHLTTIASGLTFPTAMTFSPSGTILYVTNLGFGFPAGSGQIVSIPVPD